MRRPSEGLRAVGLLAGGTFAGQAFLLLITPILSRIYSPEDFAVLGVFGSLLSMLVVIASLSFERAISIPATDEEASHVLKLSLASTALIGTLSLGVVLLFGQRIATLVQAPQAAPFLILLPISVFGAGAYQALNYWAVRKRQFEAISRTKINQSASQGIAQLGFGFGALGATGLVLGDVVNRLAGSLTLGRAAARSGARLLQWDWRAIRQAAVRYRNFPLLASGAALLHTAASVLPTLLIGNLYGGDALAQYTFTQRIITAPLTVIGVAVAQVFLGQMSAVENRTQGRMKSLYRRTLQRLSLLGLVVIGIAGVGGPALFGWLFGKDWLTAGAFVQILSLGLFVQFVIGPVLSILHVMERQSWLLFADVIGFVAIVGGLLQAHRMGLPVEQALLVASIALGLMYGLIGWLSWRALGSLPPDPIRTEAAA